jgi:hypothetical protein
VLDFPSLLSLDLYGCLASYHFHNRSRQTVPKLRFTLGGLSLQLQVLSFTEAVLGVASSELDLPNLRSLHLLRCSSSTISLLIVSVRAPNLHTLDIMPTGGGLFDSLGPSLASDYSLLHNIHTLIISQPVGLSIERDGQLNQSTTKYVLDRLLTVRRLSVSGAL